MEVKVDPLIDDLLYFLDQSPTAWHAVSNCVSTLSQHGFKELKETENWKLKKGEKYYVTRNGSTLCAFITPQTSLKAIRLAASHTDSPSFKLKPNAEFTKENMTLIGVEVYGAPMLSSWLNRDLGIAGRVIYTNKQGQISEKLVRLDEDILTIPQLAIHLDRNVNEGGPVVHKQDHLAALAGAGLVRKEGFLEQALKPHLDYKKLLSFDLFLFPLERARLLGSQKEMIASYRIDNLGSVHAILNGFAQAKAHSNVLKMIAFWDHEEIGSGSAIGAGSPFVPHLIERIGLSLGLGREDYFRLLSSGLCVSVDLAHALHPNYNDKHEPRHATLMNEGIAIKTNAQQKYASDALSTGIIIEICKMNNIPFQKYITRGDLNCGSTIGPIHATLTGMPTVDIGCPQLSMHSCRELAGTKDHVDMHRFIQAFFSRLSARG